MFIRKVTTKVSLFQRTIKSWNENYKIPLKVWIHNKINGSTNTQVNNGHKHNGDK